MKHWFNQNYKTLIIAAFLIPIITVAIVSISHVTKWYGISNPVSWAVYLSIGIEIAALSALAAISANMGKKVYFPFAIVTIVQFIGNIYFAYSYIDINSQSFKDWVGLVSPLVEFMGVDPNDFSGHKRFLAFFAGGMLPMISLSFLHMLVKFTEEDRMNEVVDDKLINKVDASDIIGEVSKLRLSDEDLAILEKHLMNPPPPNGELKKAAEEYKRRGELLAEIIKNDEELGLYNEPFDNPMIKKDKIDLKEVAEKLKDRELFPESNERAKEIIENSNWDVTLLDGLEDEPANISIRERLDAVLDDANSEEFSTIEPTDEEEYQNFSTIGPNQENFFQEDEIVPSLSDEEIMEMNQREYERDLDMEIEFDGFVPEEVAKLAEEIPVDDGVMFTVDSYSKHQQVASEPEVKKEYFEDVKPTETPIREEDNDFWRSHVIEDESEEDESKKKF